MTASDFDEDFIRESQAINMVYEVIANEFPLDNLVESVVDLFDGPTGSENFLNALESATSLERRLIENAEVDITQDIGILVLGLNRNNKVTTTPPLSSKWKGAVFENNKNGIGWLVSPSGERFIANLLNSQNAATIPVHQNLKQGLKRGDIQQLVMVHQFTLSEIAVNALKSLFGLTDAEITLCRKLSEGQSLSEAAEAQGVTRETMKSHLKNVFSKTGVRKQSELIKMLTQIAAAAAIQDLSATKSFSEQKDSWTAGPLSIQNIFCKNRYGGQISYSAFGDPNGEPVIYLHHGVGSRIHSPEAARSAKDRGFLVFQPDRPGFGHSDKMPVMSARFNAEYLEDLCAGLGIKRAKIITYGMGGRYVMDAIPYLDNLIEALNTYAYMAPRKYRPPIINPTLWQKLVMRSYDNPKLLVNFMRIGFRRIKRQTLMDHYEGSPADQAAVMDDDYYEYTQKYFSLSYRQNYAGSTYEYGRMNKPLDLSDPAKFNFPIEAWFGDQDVYADIDLMREYFAPIPNAVVKSAPGTGELLPQANFGHMLDLFFADQS